MTTVNRGVLPGFRLSLGFTMFYLSIMVLIPLGACFSKAATLSFKEFCDAVWTPRARAAYALTLGAAGAASAINVVIGLLFAWVLVRYSFPFKKLLDAIIDLPFALPTAVAGLVYSSLYAPHGWLGQWLVPLGIEGAYSRLGIVLVLIFTGLPFVVRAVQPVLSSLEIEMEEAASTLGATRWQVLRQIIWPSLMPATIAGFSMAFARSLGEYGSVVFVSGNMPFKTEIAPLLIVARLEENAYAEATAIAVVLLAMSFTVLGLINVAERWSKRNGP